MTSSRPTPPSIRATLAAELKVLRAGQPQTLEVKVEKMPEPARLVARHR